MTILPPGLPLVGSRAAGVADAALVVAALALAAAVVAAAVLWPEAGTAEALGFAAPLLFELLLLLHPTRPAAAAATPASAAPPTKRRRVTAPARRIQYPEFMLLLATKSASCMSLRPFSSSLTCRANRRRASGLCARSQDRRASPRLQGRHNLVHEQRRAHARSTRQEVREVAILHLRLKLIQHHLGRADHVRVRRLPALSRRSWRGTPGAPALFGVPDGCRFALGQNRRLGFRHFIGIR